MTNTLNFEQQIIMLGKMMCRQVPTLPIGGYATDLLKFLV